jgi:hypothetical protein
MDSMATWKILRWLTRRKHVLATHWTVVFVFILEALMSVEDTDRNAHAAFVAVTKGVCTPDPAESALTAMKRLFGLLQKKKHTKRWGRVSEQTKQVVPLHDWLTIDIHKLHNPQWYSPKITWQLMHWFLQWQDEWIEHEQT